MYFDCLLGRAMVDLGCPDYMNYLLRRYNSDRETTDHKKQKRGPDSASSEVIEVSDYTKEALQLFKQKLSTYIETVNKNHEELLLQCRWHNCYQYFPNYIRLHVHLLECHLNNAPDLICLWDSCRNDIFLDYDQLCRHILLHAFFEYCIFNTQNCLKSHHKIWNFVCCGINCQKPAYLQRTTEKFLWNPIILERGFECQWKDCDYTTNSAYLFVEHVKEHDYADNCDNINTNSSQLVCLWQPSEIDESVTSDQSVCGSVNRCRALFHRHVRRHTGLPNYICSKCYVCFADFGNLKEHFTWSLVKDEQNVIRFNDADEHNTHCPILLKLLNESSPFPKHLEGTSLFQCPTCIKVFITKQGWTSHIHECPKSVTKGTERLNRVSTYRKRVLQPYFKIASRNELPEENYTFCCQIDGCSYQASKLSAYRAHYRRYHSSSNPDGLWYSCHLCPSYRARKPCTISHHLKSVHSLKPFNGRVRFTFTFDENSQTYQLTGKPPAPKVQRMRALAPKLVKS
ncbi:DNA replication complex GINS protein SLD5 [Schistosoma japonicum]|nr:DNA replication complex GINS protein SLD5 [Schistosoma japonicum]